MTRKSKKVKLDVASLVSLLSAYQVNESRLARETGFSRGYVCGVLNEKVNPSLKFLASLMKALERIGSSERLDSSFLMNELKTPPGNM